MRDSYAARAQGIYESGDDLLDLLARQAHPTSVHWWGRRIEGARATAQCYVCGHKIATWAAKYPVTGKARERILTHRREHLAALAVPKQATEVNR